jgi:cell division protein FtsI/penicillin-binding protein 2
MLKRKQKVLLIIIFPLILMMGIFWVKGADEREAQRLAKIELEHVEAIAKTRESLLNKIGPYLSHNQYVPDADILINNELKHVKIEYTLNEDLQAEAEKLLTSYKPDYGAIVIMDAMTGEIKAMASYEKGKPSTENLALRGTYPAASVFKIITASAAMDKYKLSPDTIVMYNGGNHTLYKKNVLYTKENRWTRRITLREAFARSINTVFGRLTFERMQPKDIEEYAIKFGFNTPIKSDMPIDTGFTQIPQEKSFHLAEIVSGYNRITRMSPVQGAMIASSVAATGVMRVPYIVKSLRDEAGKVIWKSEPVTAAVTMTGEGAERLRELMDATVKSGTSRKSFRALVRDKKFQELELGGKTGSLMGDNPKGKVDWFVGYAIGGENDRLAVGAITVNKQFWTVKSSYLAQSLIKKHFKEQFSQQNQKFFNANLQEEK